MSVKQKQKKPRRERQESVAIGYRILDAIKDKTLTAQEISDHCKIAIRTFYRQFERLADRIEVVEVPGRFNKGPPPWGYRLHRSNDHGNKEETGT